MKNLILELLNENINEKRFLYHYSTNLYDIIKTKRKSGIVNNLEIKKSEEYSKKFNLIKPYVDHISLFYEPIPSKLLSNLFESHPFWFKGNKVYEYIIDIDDLESDILYQSVETPFNKEFLNKFSKDNNWTKDDPNILKKYYKELHQAQINNKEIDSNVNSLKKQSIKFNNTIEKSYIDFRKSKDYKYNKTKYASNVPHIMIYPKKGYVNYKLVNIVYIGDDMRYNL